MTHLAGCARVQRGQKAPRLLQGAHEPQLRVRQPLPWRGQALMQPGSLLRLLGCLLLLQQRQLLCRQ